MHRPSLLFFVILFGGAAAGPGCGGPEEKGGTGGGGGEAPCPAGSVAGLDGGCSPVGIQGCAEMFLEEDGLCHPSITKCPAGEIPQFDHGCVPVGIRKCAPMFMKDGICRPSMAACAGQPGTVPRFDEGCVPVGIPGCAPEFLEEDGLCHPSIAKCPEATFPVPQEGCVPVDGPDGCGGGTWGDIEDGPEVVFVDPSVPVSGDGSKASPRKTIAEALAQVQVGGRVALAAGVYDEPAHLVKDGVTLEGRCPSMVRVQGAVGTELGYAAAVWVDGATGVTVRGIEVGGAGAGIVVTSASVQVERVHVRSASSVGLAAWGMGTSVGVSHTWIDGTLGGEGEAGLGVNVLQYADVTVESSAITGSREVGVVAEKPGTVTTLVNTVVEGEAPGAPGDGLGTGVEVGAGAKLSIASSAITDNRQAGLLVRGQGADASVADSIVERTLPVEPAMTFGVGVQVSSGGKLALGGSVVSENHHVGVRVIDFSEGDPKTEATLTGSLVSGTLPEAASGTQGFGVDIRVGPLAVVALESNAIVGNHASGIYVEGFPSTEINATVIARKNLVEGTLSTEPESRDGNGIFTLRRGRVSIEDTAVLASRNAGVAVYDAGSDMTLDHSLIAGTLPHAEDGREGFGVVVAEGAAATLIADAVLENRTGGVIATREGALVTVSQSLIRDTLPQQSDSIFGYGLRVQKGAHGTLDQSAIVSSHAAGVVVSGEEGEGTDLTMTGSLVEGTKPKPSDGSGGFGVRVQVGAAATLNGNAIVANRGSGVSCFDSSLIAVANLFGETMSQQSDGLLGRGIEISKGQAMVDANAVIDNQDVGLFALAQSELHASGNLVRGTRARTADGQWGAGVTVAEGSSAQLAGTIIEDNRVAGLLVAGASIDVTGALVRGVTAGTVTLFDPRVTYDDIGDGILVARGSTVHLADARVEGCARAGVLFDASGGSVVGVTSTSCKLGLVLQGSPRPEYGSETNHFSGTEQDIVLDGDLAVPDAPAPIPDDPL